jgi:thiamine biosynthesis lipoprotein ApbE
MIESAQLSIDTVTTDKKTGEVTFTGTSPSSDTSISYTTTSSIDKTAEAKAEAKYEHDLKEIDKKDKQYDLTLSKLESERTALTTEYESVKKVIEDNIDRTFGIFS